MSSNSEDPKDREGLPSMSPSTTTTKGRYDDDPEDEDNDEAITTTVTNEGKEGQEIPQWQESLSSHLAAVDVIAAEAMEKAASLVRSEMLGGSNNDNNVTGSSNTNISTPSTNPAAIALAAAFGGLGVGDVKMSGVGTSGRGGMGMGMMSSGTGGGFVGGTSSVEDYKLLEGLNHMARERYAEVGEMVAGMVGEMEELQAIYEDIEPYVHQVSELEKQVLSLEAVATELDDYTRRLEETVKKRILAASTVSGNVRVASGGAARW
ncbi:biogenesis of lysosome- organelles complex 1 subunit 2 [Blyttiomyces sp. JEL0837]|nr:biogenesis of lysosome- organelles complex 1 subunit 2 [Blyttiomyces sp. JEL0837]